MNNDLIKHLSEAFPNLEWQEGVTCVTANNLDTVRVAVYTPFMGIYICRVTLLLAGDTGYPAIKCDYQAMDPIHAVMSALNEVNRVLAYVQADLNKAKERK